MLLVEKEIWCDGANLGAARTWFQLDNDDAPTPPRSFIPPSSFLSLLTTSSVLSHLTHFGAIGSFCAHLVDYWDIFSSFFFPFDLSFSWLDTRSNHFHLILMDVDKVSLRHIVTVPAITARRSLDLINGISTWRWMSGIRQTRTSQPLFTSLLDYHYWSVKFESNTTVRLGFIQSITKTHVGSLV